MKAALLRVGIDSGSGGIQGPLFQDGTFEFIPIPDYLGRGTRTYGNTVDRAGRPLVNFFPAARRNTMHSRPMHVDPEFETFTYGDPGQPKRRLRSLSTGDLLIFYCGLQGWDFADDPALYLCGYFEVAVAGTAAQLGRLELEESFAQNFHVRHPAPEEDPGRLVLVKGSPQSRLLRKAVRISEMSMDIRGRPLKVLSKEMHEVFGDFGGRVSIQRSPPRWIMPEFVDRAAAFVRSLD